ncbi:hypothetical protein K5E_09710 [Enterococcus thailandicus]|uniref:Uncharacterized protein n=1 Tax=bioreactor metagenome TaxID=1076179 RepID=A0A645HVK5_9ZZZZ|nr:hypothetical protein K4E_04950 [Enterococcus thailandicus]GMC08832.1 hypothetical protein K5E_09710 [Enterococcus thailandicus]
MTSPTKIGAITNEISSFTKNTPNQGQVAKKIIPLKKHSTKKLSELLLNYTYALDRLKFVINKLYGT